MPDDRSHDVPPSEGTDDQAGAGDEPERRKKWMPGVKRLPSEGIPKTSLPPEPSKEAQGDAAKRIAAPAVAPVERTDSAVRRLGVGFDKEAVRAIIERHFRVYDEKDALPGLGESVLVAYFVMGYQDDLQQRYEKLRDELRTLDPRLVPMLRMESGEAIVVMTRRGNDDKPPAKTPWILFILTVVTLVLSGAIAWVTYEGGTAVRAMFEPRYLGLGAITFALPLLFILGAQDAARRIAAHRHQVRLGPSWWIPVPPILFVPSIGSLGTLLQNNDPFPDRRALLDIGVAGPLTGFFATLPVIIIGLLLTNAAAVTSPDGNDLALGIEDPTGLVWEQGRDGGVATLPETIEDTNSSTSTFWRLDDRRPGYGGTIVLRADLLVPEGAAGEGTGEWHLIVASTGKTGAPIAFGSEAWAVAADGRVVANTTWNGTVAADAANMTNWTLGPDVVRLLVRTTYTLPDQTTVSLGEPAAFAALYDLVGRDGDYIIHPTALAGWTGLLIIGVSLLPIGRLDGGVIARAVFGEGVTFTSHAGLLLLIILSFRFLLWVHVALLILIFVKTRFPPPLNDTTELDNRRLLWAGVALIVLLVSFVWIPAHVPALDLWGRYFAT